MWFFKGKKPRSLFWWSNKKLQVFTTSIEGKKIYYEFRISQNSLIFKAFLSNFIEELNKNKNIVFILDNAGWHKTNVITNYLAKFSNIKVQFLPPYCPELNPIETCWKTTRHKITNSKHYPNIEILQKNLEIFWDKYFFKLKMSNYLCS